MTQHVSEGVAAPVYPKPVAAWGLVVLLTLAYVLSFVDRYILALLVEPIKADLELSDTQIGLLLGPAFAIFYATMGLPFGWLADRKRRTWIVGIGVSLWSLATAASGLAKSFFPLFLARMGVGVGEATLSPCAMSMIADSFPKEKRGRPIAFYTMAQSLGAAGAYFIGAGVIAWVRATTNIDIPIIGGVSGWQYIFIVVGLPGLVLGAAFFLIKEPPRVIEKAADAEVADVSILDMLGYVWSRRGVFFSYLSLFCFMTIAAYSQGWLPAMFERTWGWPAERYALVNAFVLIATAPLTINLAGWFSDKMTGQGRNDAPLKLAIIGLLLLVPTGIIYPLVPSGEMAFAVLVVNTIGIAAISAMGMLGLFNIVPAAMRGQITALYYMSISLSGLFIGPTTVGLMADHVFGGEQLNLAVASVSVIFGLPVLGLIPYMLKRYRQELDIVEGRAPSDA